MPLAVNKFLPLARLAVLGTVTFLSLIILALSAHILNFTNNTLRGFFDYAALALAVSVLSLLSLPLMLYIDKVRAGAIPSYIIVELGWLGFLWIMWLASAGTTASINITGGRCGNDRFGFSTLCGETNAIEAFAFLNWFILLGYFIALFLFSFLAYQKGNTRVWFGAVKGTDFEGEKPVNTYGTGYPTSQPTFAPQYPPPGTSPAPAAMPQV